ncbi:hypothetical protein BD779DRAFT_1628376 [Infundibulicybe gibba]|nr:hypothetical protein BD779DRAFT_1628376 [Infundibulicybe gibba]
MSRPPPTMSSLPPIPASIALLTGPPLLGIMLNWWIFGILIVQCYIYRLSFPNDEKHLKALVYTLLLLETVQTMFTTADAFHWFAFGFGDMDSLGELFLSNIDSPILGSIIAFIVQLVFCGRIWALSQSKILSGAIALFSVAQIVGGIGLGVVNQISGGLVGFRNRGLAYTILWLGGSAITDTLIAVSLTYLLLKSKSRNKRANDIILRVVRLTVETNALTATMAIIALSLVVAPSIAPPKTTMFTCPCYILGKLYSNTLMTMLNNRAYAQGKFNLITKETPVALHSNTLQITTLGIKSENQPSSASFSEL